MLKNLFLASLLISFSPLSWAKPIQHVVLIGMDGFGSAYIPKLDMPTLSSMMHNGAYSMHARSIVTSSSANNWASMTMGAGEELHGYTLYDSKTPEIPSRVLDKYGLFPSIFGILRDQHPKATMGVFYDWEGIGYLFPKQAVNESEAFKKDVDVAARASEYIKSQKPTLTFVYMEGPDVTGHRLGWGSPEFLEQAHDEWDKNLATVLKAIHDAGIEDSTLVILSADHGGLNKNHGGKTLVEMEIPWIAVGPGVKKGYEIQDSIVTYDTAATIAKALKLKAPQVWTGRPVAAAFRK
jgi:predicted AlkP superfamily pyrophosphatase or phosphodiesterase